LPKSIDDNINIDIIVSNLFILISLFDYRVLD